MVNVSISIYLSNHLSSCNTLSHLSPYKSCGNINPWLVLYGSDVISPRWFAMAFHQVMPVNPITSKMDRPIAACTIYSSVSLWHNVCSPIHRVRCHYNMVSFLQNPHNTHPIACPSGRAMGFLLWVYSISQEICTRFLLWSALLWLYIDWFSHIHQAYFTATVAI